MKYRYGLTIILAFVGSLTLWGCSKDKGLAPQPAPPPIVNPIPTTGTFTWDGPVIIKNASTYQKFLVDNYACDWNCGATAGLRLNLTLIGLKIPANGYATVYSQYGGNSVSFEGLFSYIDNYSGFELYRRGYNSHPTYNAVIRYSFYGLPSSNQPIPVKLYYRNELMATATIVRIN